jgi:hypothetical protein
MPPPKYKTFKIPKGGIVIMEMKERGDKSVTLAGETSHHDGNLAVMADPSKGNKLVTTMAHDVATAEARIKHSAAVTTKGKAPTAMTRRTTNIQVHIE